jgi:2-polyprenyl-6-methoxyphenol hydroxylase-like FAD-dependent oxidoreductase
MNMAAAETPVLVVGGRTTGLMMASELPRHDVPVKIADTSPGIDPHARATMLHSRTLEVLHGLGIARQRGKMQSVGLSIGDSRIAPHTTVNLSTNYAIANVPYAG